MASSVIDVTEANFDDVVVQSEVPVLLDFWAPWCGPCKSLNPTIETLASEFDGRIKVAKVNADENQALLNRYGGRSIPFLLILERGETLQNLSTTRSHSALSKLLQAFLDGTDASAVKKDNLQDPDLRRSFFESAQLDEISKVLNANPQYVNASLFDDRDMRPATYFLFRKNSERFDLFREHGAELSFLDLIVAELDQDLVSNLQRNPNGFLDELKTPTGRRMIAEILKKPNRLNTIVGNGVCLDDICEADRHGFYQAVTLELSKNKELGSVLLQHGLDFSTKTNEGLTAYHFACVFEIEEAKTWFSVNGFRPAELS